MKFKEIFYMLGLKPNYKFFKTTKTFFGTFNGSRIYFYQWNTPKSSNEKLDPKELDELSSFLKQGDVAIDVGAHIGDTAMPISLVCGVQGTVFAFEPNPVVFQILAKNSFINSNNTNIVPIPFACSNNAQLEFNYDTPWLMNGGDKSYGKFFHGAAFKTFVNGVNGYELLKSKYPREIERTKYIKIDVEGHDFMVLKQFESLILDLKPYIKFEIAGFTSKEYRENLWEFFSGKSYDLRIVENGKNFGRKAKREDFFNSSHFDVFCIPEKVKV